MIKVAVTGYQRSVPNTPIDVLGELEVVEYVQQLPTMTLNCLVTGGNLNEVLFTNKEMILISPEEYEHLKLNHLILSE